MATREEIREGMAEVEYEETDWYMIMSWAKAPNFVKDICYKRADRKLSRLQELGVVIKVDRELPLPIMYGGEARWEDILKAGYVAVEPLIRGE